MRSKPSFQEGIRDLLILAEGAKIALMCAEGDPSRCHRRLLIGPALEEHGFKLLHIRRDGSVQGSEALSHKNAYQSQLQGRLPV